MGHVWQGSPEEVWTEISELAGVDKRGFDTYYEGREIAYALQVTDVWEYENLVDLSKTEKSILEFCQLLNPGGMLSLKNIDLSER